MSEEQLKAFLEKVQSDKSLQEKLNGAADADGVVAIAKVAGFIISSDDLKSAQSQIKDAELEGAAGGLLGTWNQQGLMCYKIWDEGALEGGYFLFE